MTTYRFTIIHGVNPFFGAISRKWSTSFDVLPLPLGVVLKAENRIIGGCTLDIVDQASRQGAFAYLLHRRYWGHGYATKVLRALVAFGFDALGLHRIADECDAENVASARVMEKVGLRCEGRLREHVWEKGRWCDSLIYAILEEEWRAQAHHHG